MNRALVTIGCAALAAFTLAGCVPSTEKTTVNVGPDLSVSETPEIDFTQLHNDTIEIMDEYAEPYSFIDGVDISGNDDERLLTVSCTAGDGATEQDCKDFAGLLLRSINDAANIQYLGFDLSTPDNFGNFYDSYSLELEFYSSADGSELYTLSVPAGEDIPLDPDYETYVEDWEQAAEIYSENIVYNASGEIISD